MNNSIVTLKMQTFLFALLIFPVCSSFAQADHEGDWFSENTLASVVKLSSVRKIYEVDGLPDNYTYHTKGGKPDFGGATVISERIELSPVGTGVIIKDDGLIISNAHVTQAWAKPKIVALPGTKGIKRIFVNPLPDIMFVGAANTERLAKGDDSQKLQYAAYVIADDANPNDYRDRAVLQIVYHAHLGNVDIPVIDGEVEDLHMPCATFGNPFKTSFVDRKVRAIGFPGTGDPNRSARTAGELLGYQNQNVSEILHTSYISGGNSGGGLFYKDNLIGINTWDNMKNASRPVAIAQPITYWFDMLIKAQWKYTGLELPDGLLLDWLSDDPGKEPYKNEVQVLFALVSESNKNAPVTSGRLYVHRADTDIDDVLAYIDIAKRLDDATAIIHYLQYYSVDEVVDTLGYSRAYVEQFQSVANLNQLRAMLKPQLRSYFDEWNSGTFYCKVIELTDSEGKTAISVPKNSRLHVTYLSEKTRAYTTLTLTCNDEYVQGPYTVSVKQ